MSPTLQVPIGMGYVPASLSKTGSTFAVKAGTKMLAAKAVDVPFIKLNLG